MRGTSISVAPDERIKSVRVSRDELTVDLMDGRTIAVPVAWFPRLQSATAGQRSKWRITGAGFGIHWPEIDEDIGVAGLLRVSSASGRPRRRRQTA
ncbi:MAG: DUF2442 domain-containing protein [Rhodospirillales bacterium]